MTELARIAREMATDDDRPYCFHALSRARRMFPELDEQAGRELIALNSVGSLVDSTGSDNDVKDDENRDHDVDA